MYYLFMYNYVPQIVSYFSAVNVYFFHQLGYTVQVLLHIYCNYPSGSTVQYYKYMVVIPGLIYRYWCHHNWAIISFNTWLKHRNNHYSTFSFHGWWGRWLERCSTGECRHIACIVCIDTFMFKPFEICPWSK